MTRRKAFFIHLLLSATACIALLLLFVEVWYPMPYFAADGGWQGLRLLIAVTCVLGPLLTLVVSSRSKSRGKLLFDYTVIGLLQLLVLGFGTWTVFANRTVLVVFADGSFYTVDAQTAERMGGNAALVIASSKATPAYGCVRMPPDVEGRQRLRKEALRTGRALFQRSDLLEPLGPGNLAEILEREPSMARSMEKEPGYLQHRDRFLGHSGRPLASYVFAPLMCRYDRLVLVLDRLSGRPADWLPVHPK